MFRFLSLCATGCLVICSAQDNSKPQLTARELFYSAGSDTPAKTPAKAPQKSTPTTPPKRPSTPTTTQTAAADKPPVTSPKTESSTLPGGGKLTQVAMATTAPAPASGTPLGLKYTIMKLSGSDWVPVPYDSVFHNGDHIQFSVQTNGPGFLYIISQGSSGTWKPMFPSPEVEDGDNRVDGWHAYSMPPKTRIAFDEQTGVEKVFIVFSREPESGLENMIYSLQGNKPKPASVQTPTPKPNKQMVQIASLNIDDATVGHLRQAYGRDLIIERMDDKTPADKAEKKENSVYVVNPSGSADSRVVADLKLVHQ